MQVLADTTAAAAYSEGGVATDDATAATAAADQIRDQLASSATNQERLRWALGLKTSREGPPARIRAVETLIPGS